MPASASFFKSSVLLAVVLSLSGCQFSYLVHTSYNQMALLAKKRRNENVLKDPSVDAETKRKISLAQEAKKFAEEKLGLLHTRNYDAFVDLKRDSVTYTVVAAYKDQLKPYTWSFPFVGEVPYKGYFDLDLAKEEQKKLEAMDLDTQVRGVAAYSTLGWFADPLLSSMTKMSDLDLVETVIHETTHATLFIKSNAEFNEQLATFVGIKGAESFFELKEGANSPQIELSRKSREDSKVFSDWISSEIKKIEEFYSQKPNDWLKAREQKFEAIKVAFDKSCAPKLKTDAYSGFSKSKINNAVLVGYKTYYNDLSIFEKAFKKSGGSWAKFFEVLKELKSSAEPEKDLRRFVDQSTI